MFKKKHPIQNRRHIDLFTSNDLDGAGCAVLLELFAKFTKRGITVTYCHPSALKGELLRFKATLDIAEELDSPLPKERDIFITNLPLTEDVLPILDSFADSFYVHAVDHHEPSPLCQRPWAYVSELSATSSTAQLLKYLYISQHPFPVPYALARFCESITAWELQLFLPHKKRDCEDLYFAWKILGGSEFCSFIIGAIFEEPNQELKLGDTYLEPMITEARGNRSKYIYRCSQKPFLFYDKGYIIVAVFADQFVSEIANHILESFPHADIAAVIQMPFQVTLRTNREDIDLFNKMAKEKGGSGGRREASYPIDQNISSGVLSPFLQMDYHF